MDSKIYHIHIKLVVNKLQHDLYPLIFNMCWLTHSSQNICSTVYTTSYITSQIYHQVSLILCDGVKLSATGVGAMGWSFSSGVINSLQDK